MLCKSLRVFRFSSVQRQLQNDFHSMWELYVPGNLVDCDISQSVDGLCGHQLSRHDRAFCLGFTMYSLVTFGHGCFPNGSPIFSLLRQSSCCTATEGLAALAEDTGQHLKGFGPPDWWNRSLAGDWIVYSMDRKGPLLFLPIHCCLNPN